MALSTAGKIYVGSIVCAGGLVFAAAHHGWSSADPPQFLLYLLLTALASGLKVRLPGVTGTMSVSFVLLLCCVIRLSIGEVVDVGIASALVQCFWKAKERPRLVHLACNLSLMVMSTAMADLAYHMWPPHTSVVIALGSATCAYFVVNTLSVAGAIAVTEGKPFLAIWRNFYLWSFPYYLFGASLAAAMTFVTRFNWEIAVSILPLVFIIYRSYTLHLQQLEEEKRHAEAMAALHLRTIETLALAIEAKDQTTADHLRRVQVYSNELSKDLGLAENQRRALEAASILHDVGKIAIPDYIISKPGRLTPEEFEKMKIHPLVGAEIAERIDFPYPVAPIVRAHHEKWDGSGYPYGLRRDEIPIGARILAVVDCFDALASHRQYRKALSLDEAMAAVTRESGKSFDPAIVDLLGRRYLELEKIAQAAPVRVQPKLSMDAVVERGHSPGAGFETAALPPGARAVPSNTFSESAMRLGMSLDLDEALAVLCSRAVRLIPAEAVAVFVLEGKHLTPKYVQGENFALLSSLHIALGEGVAGWVAENHKPILNGNPAVEPGYASGVSAGIELNSVLAVPLHTSSHTFGVLALYRGAANAFSRDTLDDLIGVSEEISRTLDGLLQLESDTSVRNIDARTGLPNKRALLANIEAQIAKCRDSSSALTVLYCGMEGLAEVDDSFGEIAAEEALRRVTQAFRQTCSEVEYLARAGSDDFALVIPGLSVDALEVRIGVLQRAVHQAGMDLWGSQLLSLNVGAASYPWNGDIPEGLLAEAERQMSAARASQKQEIAAALP